MKSNWGVTEKALSAKELYSYICTSDLLITNSRTAEMAKLRKCFRDVNIAFANELSVICDEIGIDINELINLTNHIRE